jgi:two-component system sensor histidine kinase MprB
VSLRRRITGAATLAVAAVAVTLGVVGYLSTRSHLVGELQRELRGRASQFLQPHAPVVGKSSSPQVGATSSTQVGATSSPQGGGTSSTQGGATSSTQGGATNAAQGGATASGSAVGPGVPAPPRLGGAPGYFQFVHPDGTVVAGNRGTPQLPVDARVLRIATSARGSFFSTARIGGIHVEILTIGDPFDHYAVEVDLPLTGVDSVLSSLALTYALLIGVGVLLAGVLGTLIARSALAPIERFSEQTEQVTSALDRPRRLEETGASELRRLAHSFNRTLDALERSIQSQRHLIADASHELRTPMAALRSNIQIFLQSHRLPEEEREGLQHAIVAELDELTQLVADVVELARGSAPSEHTEAIELDQIVREAVERAQRRATQLRFSLELEPTVIVNAPDRVGRAVTNVIDNARKWSPPDGQIEVLLRDGLLSVRDHGPGFQEADLQHVFDRFYRAEQARRMPGSGLGLAIVKQAAEAHGGSVEAANAPDGGAVLRISFGPSTGTSALAALLASPHGFPTGRP